MAKQTVVELLSDLSPDEPADTTVQFGINGHSYEIDLTDEEADELHELLSPYIEAGRRVSGRGRAQRRPARAASAGKRSAASSTTDVRQWARENGIPVAERGRLPKELIERFEAAQ